jgi:hypothetical protein
MDPEIIKGLFEQGVSDPSPTLFPDTYSMSMTMMLTAIAGVVGWPDLQLMGIETKTDHGGAECSFVSAIIAIEGSFSLFPPSFRSTYR